MNDKAAPFIITVCSGKGGVGKSVLAANMAYFLAKTEKKVLLWDADLFFPNLHIINGVEPQVRVHEVYTGQTNLENAFYNINENLSLLADAAAPGKIERIKPYMLHDVYLQIIEQKKFDAIIIDTPAAGSKEVIQCCSFADVIAVVINDEPTSLLDAYGLIKILIQYFENDKIKLIVNNVIDEDDAEEFSTKLNLATEKFLEINIETLGYVPYSRFVRQSILKQVLFSKSEPDSDISESIKVLCDKLMNVTKEILVN